MAGFCHSFILEFSDNVLQVHIPSHIVSILIFFARTLFGGGRVRNVLLWVEGQGHGCLELAMFFILSSFFNSFIPRGDRDHIVLSHST